MKPSIPKGPQFLRFAVPILDALRELGSSGLAGEVTDIVIERAGIDEDALEATTTSGQSKVKNQIGWARFYLVKAGLIDGTQRGVWTLTEAGQQAKLSASDVSSLFKTVHEKFQPRAAPRRPTRSWWRPRWRATSRPKP